MIELDISDPRAVEWCCRATEAGEVWGGCLGEVYALCWDGLDSRADEKMRRMKGGVRGLSSGLLGLSWVPRLIDVKNTYPQGLSRLLNGEYVVNAFGNTAFLRYPVMVSSRLPLELLRLGPFGRSLFQQFSFVGSPYAYEIEEACAKVVGRFHQFIRRPPAVGITSMNWHGRPPICDPAVAAEFCQSAGVELLIHNASSQLTGSYPIVEVGRQGSFLRRTGNREAEKILRLLPKMELKPEG